MTEDPNLEMKIAKGLFGANRMTARAHIATQLMSGLLNPLVEKKGFSYLSREPFAVAKLSVDLADMLLGVLFEETFDEEPWAGPGETRHQYVASNMHMGDCAICGHTYSAHFPDPVATAQPAAAPERVRHIKRGSTYTVIGQGYVQTGRGLHDYDDVVIYKSEEDGSLWVRPVDEFNDPERFQKIGGTDGSQG